MCEALAAWGRSSSAYLVLAAILSASAYLLGDDVERFALAFTGVFATIALRELVRRQFSASSPPSPRPIRPSSASRGRLSSPTRAGSSSRFSRASLIANVFPAFAELAPSAVRPELYSKVAIVILWRPSSPSPWRPSSRSRRR